VQLTEQQLRGLIRQTLSETRKVTLSNGKNVGYGTKVHIKYLEKMLNNLEHERNSYRRDSSTRADYSRAVGRTKKRLNRAKKYAEKHELF
jgi:hypothetical protein